MAGRLTMWGASQLLTTYFGKTTEPPPVLYLALIKDIAPNPYLDGSELDEPANVDYARVPMENNLANWSNNSAPQEVYNLKSVAFVTAVSTWGRINYWALCNADVDGENLIVGDLETPVMIEAGDQVVFSPSDLSVALGPFFLFEAE